MESWQKTALGIKLCTLQNEENSWGKKEMSAFTWHNEHL